MSQWIVPPVGLIEPVPAPEIYVDDFAAIELIGNNMVCLHGVVYRQSIESAEAPTQSIVVVRMLRPIASIPVVTSRIMQILMPRGEAPPILPFGGKPHLVR